MTPSLLSPEPSEACLWTKARENITRFIRAKGRVKKSRRAWGKRPQEKMWCVLVAAWYFMMMGWEQKGRWTAGGGKVATVKWPAWSVRPAGSFSVGPLERENTGPEIRVWLLHSSQLLLNRHRSRNVFKTKETNGDGEGTVMCCGD